MAPDPILEGLLVPGNNNTDLEQNLQPDHPATPNGHDIGKRAKNLLLFSTVCCIGLVCFALSTSVVLDGIALPPSSGKPELKRVTHAPSVAGYGNGTLLGAVASYLHRTSFHFQPEKNWMNDPNGPVYYKGYYHLFYQYNPEGALWGNIVWGHAVSRDLINWLYLDLALVADEWYDVQGVWSGSITIREDGVPIILYTGSSAASEQTQSIAYPEDPSDPMLRKWVKDPENPILRHPAGVGIKDFRDPTTAWKDENGQWVLTVGAKIGTTGMALLYKSDDLKHWELQTNPLHAVPRTGMWECVDFYPIANLGQAGLDSYLGSPPSKYVLKVSLDDDRHDYYALGGYNRISESFVPDDVTRDAGIGLRYDYGKFYASKTFFDPVKQRRILWGWVNESDSEANDIAKGWASLMAVPRALWYDTKTKNNLIQVPVEEINGLRGNQVTHKGIHLGAGEVIEVPGATGSQLDIEVVFDYPNVTKVVHDDAMHDDGYHFDCSQGGAAHRGLFGPFGLLVLADERQIEQTAIFFYISYSRGKNQWTTRFCSDQTRSSLLPDVDTTVYGSFVEVLPNEDTLSLRVLIDRSVVESFVQGGRMVITSRVYPTVAADQASHLFLFNNATTAMNVRRIDAWQMETVAMHAI